MFMVSYTPRFKNYLLPRARQPVVDSIICDELGKAVLAQHNKRFRGRVRIEDRTFYAEGEPLSFINIPIILGYNQILRKETNGRITVLNPTELIQYWDAIPEHNTTSADTDAITIFPKEGPNEDLRKKVLNIIGKQRIKVPLFVSGLGVEKADNEYGFTFVGTDYMNVTEAPFATRDQNIAYDPEKGLIASPRGVRIWTPLGQSGLRRAYRGRSEGLVVSDYRLLNSSVDGRVQVVQGPQGRAENLETRIK